MRAFINGNNAHFVKLFFRLSGETEAQPKAAKLVKDSGISAYICTILLEGSEA